MWWRGGAYTDDLTALVLSGYILLLFVIIKQLGVVNRAVFTVLVPYLLWRLSLVLLYNFPEVKSVG